MRGKVPSSQQMQEKAAGEPTPGRSFGLQQAKQRKTSLWETGGPGFYHVAGGIVLVGWTQRSAENIIMVPHHKQHAERNT
jgi:hypothetical protein